MAAGIAGRLAAGARYRWTLVVRSVRVPPALCPPGGGPEHQAATAMLKGFEVHAVGPAEIQQRVELGADRERERVIEAPFFDHFGTDRLSTDRLSTDRLSVTRAPGCCQPGLTQRIADLDQLLGQAPKTPIFGVFRPDGRRRRRRNEAGGRLAGPLPSQRQNRAASSVGGRGATTARPAASAATLGQRTRTHLTNRRQLTAQLGAAPFQGGNLFIGHAGNPPSTRHPYW